MIAENTHMKKRASRRSARGGRALLTFDRFDSSNLQLIFEASENVSRNLRILKVVFEYFSRNPKAVDRRGDPRVDSRL
ncbi:hypothetical protein QFZ91_007401 [Paraburkholderia sp. JPY419]